MSADSLQQTCITTSIVFLEPTEQDTKDGIVYTHKELVVQIGSTVQLLELFEHGVKFGVGNRIGVAPRYCFSIFTKPLPNIPDTSDHQGVPQLWPTPPRQVRFNFNPSNHVEQSTPTESTSHVSIEMPRGDDIGELNDTLQAMDLAEKPVISSTPAPNLIFRSRQNTGVGQKRPKPDSSMLDAGDISDRNTNTILAKFDTLGRQLTTVIHQAVLNINTNTNGAISQQTDAIVAKIQSCYENGIDHQASVHGDIIKVVRNSHATIQQQQDQLISKFSNLVQSTQNLGSSLIQSSTQAPVFQTTTTSTNAVPSETNAMCDIDSEVELGSNSAVGCSYLPPSSNVSAIQSELNSKKDRASQGSLKFIRTHPEKIPRWSAFRCIQIKCAWHFLLQSAI